MPSSGRDQQRFWTRKMTALLKLNMGRKPGVRNSIMVILEFCSHEQVRLGTRSVVFTDVPVRLLIHIMPVPRGGALSTAGSIHHCGTGKVQIG